MVEGQSNPYQERFMKILFICRGNVGRSQMAEAMFNNRASDEFQAFSAGTWVKNKSGESMHGRKINELDSAKEVINSISEIGIDIADNERTQLDPKMVEDADLVIVMAEKHTLPDYLEGQAKARYWEVLDPKDMDQESTNEIRNQISGLVDELISELGAKK